MRQQAALYFSAHAFQRGRGQYTLRSAARADMQIYTAVQAGFNCTHHIPMTKQLDPNAAFPQKLDNPGMP
ncbi:hypothetical protein D3C74_435140 [compost metagenome]